MEQKKMLCPICSKEFNFDIIEGHVDKCLFLNSNEESGSKRPHNDQQSPKKYSAKKSKRSIDFVDGASSSSTTGEENLRKDVKKPLAEQMRPSCLNEFIGQKHILGTSSVLRALLEQSNIPSMILWGPPGCGKTTLANVIYNMCKEKTGNLRYTKLSATMAGVNDVKEIVKIAKNEIQSFKRQTILFMDEIHRFNKLQQDTFLPHVENGTIILIGATTENPSFSLNSALLSRCRVFVLEKLKLEEIVTILTRAAEFVGAAILDNNEKKTFEPNTRYVIEEATIKWLADISDGDARIALNGFQMALESHEKDIPPYQITLDDIKEGIKRSHLLYDRKGEEHYNTISALHKSIRASDDNAALYWLARMLEGGEDPMFIARRLVRAASEDVGIVDPMALTLAVSAMHGCQLIGMPECDVLLAQVVVYLARTHKSQEVYKALGKAKNCVNTHEGALPGVPLHLRNASTKLMSQLGYGRGYNTRNKDDSNLTYLPEGLESINFFNDP